MKFNVETAKQAANRAVLVVKKHSPKILMVGGVASTVAGTVLCCKATLKVDEVLEEHHSNLEKINSVLEDESITAYSEEDAKKDVVITYAKTAKNFAKLYWPGVALSVLGISCMLGANGILSKRNAGLLAAYKGAEQAFKEYRDRVVEALGVEKDQEFRYGLKSGKITTSKVKEDGKIEKVKEDVLMTDAEAIERGVISQYARFFDDASDEWRNNSEYNLMFLKTQQHNANDMLRKRGHVFLNEIYDMLGLKRTQAGAIVGWVYDPEELEGDNCIDFGLYDVYSAEKRDFVNGFENAILLDFNVDGVIYDLIS